jgi:hypothetical protein
VIDLNEACSIHRVNIIYFINNLVERKKENKNLFKGQKQNRNVLSDFTDTKNMKDRENVNSAERN